jgi:hypothetical protein
MRTSYFTMRTGYLTMGTGYFTGHERPPIVTLFKAG